MKCIACGREMSDRGTYYECTNVLCDYEEEIERKEAWVRLKPAEAGIAANSAMGSFPFSSVLRYV
jgi:hypothetical protein